MAKQVMLLVLMAVVSSQALSQVDANVPHKCPPCGCRLDSVLVMGPGRCSACEMKLIPVKSGTKGHIADTLSPIFRDGFFGHLYPKLIYPIFAIAVLACLYLILLHFRGRSINIYLISLMLTLSLYGFKHSIYGIRHGITGNNTYLFLPLSYISVLGALIYFYTQSLIRQAFRPRAIHWLHFAPGVLFSTLYVVPWIIPTSKEQLLFSPFDVSFSHFEQITALLLGFSYLWISHRTIQSTDIGNAPHLAEVKPWLRRCFIWFGLLFVVWASIILINYWFFDLGVSTLTYNPLWLVMALLLIWIAIEILKNPRFFLLSGPKIDTGNTRVLTESDVARYTARLDGLMTHDLLYTNPELTLNQLASEMDINVKYLSMLLNNYIGKSFYDYVNGHRIEAVKKMLKDPQNRNLTIEGIANKAGFKSKSTFNAVFKKQLKMTPREYLRSAS